MSLMQRARGVIGTMSIWAVVFGAVGLAGLIPLSFLDRMPPFELSRLLRIAVDVFVRWGLGGGGMGLAFATAILLGERRRSLDALSRRRFTAWGFLAGAIVPMGIATLYELAGHSSVAINLRTGAIFAGVCGTVGATLAVVTLKAARRAPLPLAEDPRVRAPII